jgi:hypothetical protein
MVDVLHVATVSHHQAENRWYDSTGTLRQLDAISAAQLDAYQTAGPPVNGRWRWAGVRLAVYRRRDGRLVPGGEPGLLVSESPTMVLIDDQGARRVVLTEDYAITGSGEMLSLARRLDRADASADDLQIVAGEVQRWR